MPATTSFVAFIATTTANPPTSVPSRSTPFPSQSGNRRRTRASNAFRSIRPTGSAQCAESAGSALTCRSARQNPSRERSVSPASTAASIRANVAWSSSPGPVSTNRPYIHATMGVRTRSGPSHLPCDGGPATSNSTIPERPAHRADAFELVTLDGRYHIVDRIAAGGMGEVFRAQDAVLAREVAIKVLHRPLAGDQGFVDRFRREARAAAVLSHPNIVAVHDWGSVDGIYYMVMEFVRGQSLRDIL